MSHKKVLSALMALLITASMTVISVGAEEDVPENDVIIEETNNHGEILEDAPEETQAPETEAPAPTEAETEAPATSAPEETTKASSTTTVNHPDGGTGPGTTTTTDTTDTTEDTDSTDSTDNTKETTTTSKSTEKVTGDLSAPKMGEFKIFNFADVNPDAEGGGSYAVISWDAVEGAEGYQVYRVLTLEGQGDIPTSQSFDVKGTSYQTSESNTPNSESVRVRAFKTVNGEKVYGPWSATKTVYLNGMKAPETTAAKSTSKTSTTTAKTSVTSSSSSSSSAGKTESPKTGDALPIVTAAAVSALLSGFAAKKRK